MVPEDADDDSSVDVGDDADDESGVDAADDAEVMASVDAAELVIADVAREDAWLSVEAEQAPVLREWC